MPALGALSVTVARLRVGMSSQRMDPDEDIACIGFESAEQLRQVITPNRLRLLHALCGGGPVSVFEAARRVGREPTQVQADLMALLRVGVLVQKAQSVECPYDSIEVDLS